jgi:hypothetical protein
MAEPLTEQTRLEANELEYARRMRTEQNAQREAQMAVYEHEAQKLALEKHQEAQRKIAVNECVKVHNDACTQKYSLSHACAELDREGFDLD